MTYFDQYTVHTLCAVSQNIPNKLC